MSALMDGILQFWKEEDGATAVEYGVLVALIIAAVVIVIAALGQRIKNGFESVNAALKNANL